MSKRNHMLSKLAASVIGMLGVAATALAQTAIDPNIWRPVAAENLIVISVDSGDITIELAEDFAPNHVQRMRDLSSSGALDGKAFYRVIDGFVAQGGLNEESSETFPNLVNENDQAWSNKGFVPLGNADLFAPEVGHIDGFPIGRNETLGRQWLLHCPGALAMARNTDPDTGAADFYVALGPQRYLDRNLTVFGRVLEGMEHLQALARGDRDVNSGVLDAIPERNVIRKVTLASTLPIEAQSRWFVMRSNTQDFEDAKRARRVRTADFFYRKPPPIIDICSFTTPAQKLE